MVIAKNFEKQQEKSFSFMPKVLYLISVILILIILGITTYILDYDAIGIFTVFLGYTSFPILIGVIFFFFWTEKLERNIASDISLIGVWIAFLLSVLSFFTMGEGGLGIAMILLVLIAVFIVGSFVWLIIALIINKNYKTIGTIIIIIICAFLISFYTIKYFTLSNDEKYYKKGFCDAIKNKELKDDCKLEIVLKNEGRDIRVAFCKEIEDGSKRSQCEEIICKNSIIEKSC